MEVGIAAIQAGADAVYIGAPEFGARQAAGNSLEDITQLVKYAHRFGVNVLVTLNTLLHEDEYPRACALAHELYKVGVDALIIQDLHLLDYDLPPIRLHASTQCDNRTPEQVLRLQQMGFRRAVLARELSLEQIRDIHHTLHSTPYTLHRDEVAPIELEAFVHGALCVSYSGRCYLSEALMNRSANRGCCAQLCRQRYDLLDKDGNEIIDDNGQPIHQRYLLSLQDMDRSRYLAEMIEAGITTFKIEGRLKDRDYVTNIVAYYRQLLDQLMDSHPTLQHASTRSVYQYNFTPNPAKTFHRGGTDYFLHGRTAKMANWQTPKSTGEKIGTVIATKHNAIRVQLLPNITLHNGDGLCYEDQGFTINRIEGDWIFPNIQVSQIGNRVIGTTLYRNLDIEFLRSLQAERRMPITIRFEVVDAGYRLTIGEKSTIFEAEHQSATNPERALQTIIQQLSKLGDTDYIANQWRRELIASHSPTGVQYPIAKRPLPNSPTGVQYPIGGTPSYSEASHYPLMTCKYCILHELGHCRKNNPMTNEPRYLRLQNGTILTLEFDCKHCEMRITKH